MKKTKTEKLGLSSNTIRTLSQPISVDKLKDVAGGTTSCLPVTRPTGGCH